MAVRGTASRAGRCPKALGSRRSGRGGAPPEGVGQPCRFPPKPAAPRQPHEHVQWPQGPRACPYTNGPYYLLIEKASQGFLLGACGVEMRGIASRAGRCPPRGPKALGSRRSGRLGEPPEGVGKP